MIWNSEKNGEYLMNNYFRCSHNTKIKTSDSVLTALWLSVQ